MSPPAGRDPLLDMALNLSRFHREHEKHYAESPLHDALELQRCAGALRALAERWSAVVPQRGPSAAGPFAGAEDLNDERAIESLGILFMEGQGEPPELTALKATLKSSAERSQQVGAWLASAMDSAWTMAERLLDYAGLADMLGVRHRIIANDWRAAELAKLAGLHLARAADVLERVDFVPAALRADLEAERSAPAYLFSAAELVDRAVDLYAESSVLTRDNERHWRAFRERVDALAAAGAGS